jgi:hypothetical protein
MRQHIQTTASSVESNLINFRTLKQRSPDKSAHKISPSLGQNKKLVSNTLQPIKSTISVQSLAIYPLSSAGNQVDRKLAYMSFLLTFVAPLILHISGGRASRDRITHSSCNS